MIQAIKVAFNPLIHRRVMMLVQRTGRIQPIRNVNLASSRCPTMTYGQGNPKPIPTTRTSWAMMLQVSQADLNLKPGPSAGFFNAARLDPDQ